MVYVFILLCNVIRGTEEKRQMEYKFKSPFSEHTNCVKTALLYPPKSHTKYFSVACYVNEQHVLSWAFLLILLLH